MERQRRETTTDALAHSREGGGSPFVFLHGLGASGAQARTAVAGIRDVERITIDAPAHGESASSPVPLNFGSFARAVVDLLDTLDIDTAILGGISMGAGISLRIASDFPDRVAALVLVRPAWTDRPARPHLDIVADIGEWIEVSGADGAHDRLRSDDRYQRMVEHEPLAAASVANAIESVAATGRPEVLHAMVESSPVDDLRELAEIQHPTLVISTERDRLHPVSVAEAVAAALQNATSLTAPPRYLEPAAHQEFLTDAINAFVPVEHRPPARATGERS